ncbi:orotidine-5'-phosphate decarboxylase [Methylohalomonas lacus]|uniref:Orotidine 5'-phosphate decarboxylase n=1 Tax=Methylohalomonas lacus TaxID=398773 RepID=A0AAE3HKU7_9GAMM|nr:orotidine-5'-phosphate decarboxylase [Methylohalomonas lacus]MCS3902293.1 orotidine-5'-phosphate decarboxylase [Methylohalomonas lacus]
MSKTEPRIIVALDYADAEPARQLAAQLDPARCRLKVGKELFTASGPALVGELVERGFGVFLDLKYHDIPATVAAACRAAAGLGVWMVNVHASGGRRMLEVAAEAVRGADRRPLLTAVTVLTSLSVEEFAELGYQRDIDGQVTALADLSRDCGLDGVVCSAREAASLRGRFDPAFRLVTPGIRPAGSDADDQRRIMTPADAVRAGVDYMVIGRPITRAADPLAVLGAIEHEIETAVEEAV